MDLFDGLSESSKGDDRVLHEFIPCFFHLLVGESEILEAFLGLIVIEKSIIVGVAVVHQGSSKFHHTFPGDTGVLDHDLGNSFSIRLGDIVALEALLHFPSSDDTILVGVAHFPVLPGGGVEVEFTSFFDLKIGVVLGGHMDLLN